MSSENVMEFTDASFNEEVVNAETPVLVDFWAEWCMPCKMIGPIVEELAGEYDGKVKFGRLNVDNGRQVAIKLGIQAIPTLMIFKDGQVVKSIVGLRSKNDLKARIDAVLA